MREDEAVLSRKPSEEELIFDAKTYFLKRYDAIIRNSNRYKHKEKFFPKKAAIVSYATVGIFHPIASAKGEKYDIGIDLKQLLALNDWDLFEKAVSLNIPFCSKNEIFDFCGQKLLTCKDINGLTARFYGFLFDQEILIKQTLVHDGYSFEEHINNEKNFYP